MVFYNLCGSNVSEKKDAFSKSYSNESEVRFVLNLYNTFLKLYPSYASMSVVILTPYKEQKSLVQRSAFPSYPSSNRASRSIPTSKSVVCTCSPWTPSRARKWT